MTDEKIISKRVAREILSEIEKIYFSEEFREYQINHGTNGLRDYFIEWIKHTYDVK